MQMEKEKKNNERMKTEWKDRPHVYVEHTLYTYTIGRLFNLNNNSSSSRQVVVVFNFKEEEA